MHIRSNPPHQPLQDYGDILKEYGILTEAREAQSNLLKQHENKEDKLKGTKHMAGNGSAGGKDWWVARVYSEAANPRLKGKIYIYSMFPFLFSSISI